MPSPDRSGTLPGSPSFPAARGGLPCGRTCRRWRRQEALDPHEHGELWGPLSGPAPARSLSAPCFPIPPLVTSPQRTYQNACPAQGGARSKGDEGKERCSDWRRNKVSVGAGLPRRGPNPSPNEDRKLSGDLGKPEETLCSISETCALGSSLSLVLGKITWQEPGWFARFSAPRFLPGYWCFVGL